MVQATSSGVASAFDIAIVRPSMIVTKPAIDGLNKVSDVVAEGIDSAVASLTGSPRTSRQGSRHGSPQASRPINIQLLPPVLNGANRSTPKSPSDPEYSERLARARSARVGAIAPERRRAPSPFEGNSPPVAAPTHLQPPQPPPQLPYSAELPGQSERLLFSDDSQPNEDAASSNAASFSSHAGSADSSSYSRGLPISPLQPGEAEQLLVRLLVVMPHLAGSVRELRAELEESHAGSLAEAAGEAAAIGLNFSAPTLHELARLVAAEGLDMAATTAVRRAEADLGDVYAYYDSSDTGEVTTGAS